MISDLIVGSLGLGLSAGFAQWWGSQMALPDPAPAPIEVSAPRSVEEREARTAAERIAGAKGAKLQSEGPVIFRDHLTAEHRRELERAGVVATGNYLMDRTWYFPVVDDRPGWISWAFGWALLMALAVMSGTILLLGAGLLP